MAISFRFNDQKAAEALCWLVNEQPGIDLYTLVKAVYYADKKHLLEYARPVVGDRYFAMEHGMVPSIIYDALKGEGRHGDELSTVLQEVIETRGGEYPTYFPLREPDLGLLSGSDIRALRAGLERCVGLDFEELRRMAHQEHAYNQAWRNRPANARSARMYYEEMIDMDDESKEQLLRQLEETAPYLVL